MLRSIRVKNWLSYASASVVDLDESRVIAVVGENGSGKSALLEAVPYALYGISRSTAGDMTRVGEEEHSVEVELVGNFSGGAADVLKVTRGRDKSGKGFAQVRINGVLISKGGEASDNVAEILGMGPTEFMLTAFFGLGGNAKQDALLSVTPSQRLETLQQIAGVEVYKRFHDRAKEREKALTLGLALNERELGILKEDIEDPEAIQLEIEETTASLEGLKVDHSDKVGTRNTYTSEMDRYTALIREREVLTADIRNSSRQLNEIESMLAGHVSRIDSLKRDTVSLAKLRDSLSGQITGIGDAASAELLRSVEARVVSNRTLIKIKSLGESTASGSCPLCGSPVDAETVRGWRSDIVALTSEIKSLEKSGSECKAAIDNLEQLRAKHATALNSFQTKLAEVEALDLVVERLKKKDRSVRGDEEALRVRRDKIDKDIGENYDRINAKLVELTGEIETLREWIGGCESTIKSARERLSLVVKAHRRIKEVSKIILSERETIGHLQILSKAFSRYGIPMELLSDIRALIEERATAIYREFDNGFIRVEDTEGARPGVDFVLMDQKGRRPYKLLSQGESAMFYLAVRVAVGEAVAETGGGVDFLILDELTANLSPNRRDDLVRVIGKVLRLRYPQIAMVSHASMREVFDREISVEVHNGISLAASKGR